MRKFFTTSDNRGNYECEKYYPERAVNSDLISNLCRSGSGDSALHVAAQHGRIRILKYLVETTGSAVDIRNHDRKTPLHDAAQFSQYGCVEYLLQNGADVNAVKKADWTPLMLACTKLNIEVVSILLTHGADPLFRNKDGWNSFHLATREGSVKILDLLLDNCPISSPELQQLVNSRSRNGRKPLHTAAMHGHLAVVEYLLQKEFTDVDDTDNCGTTPLMDAVRSGSTEIVDLLVMKYGAKTMCTNKTGYNCLHVAAEVGNSNMILHLIQNYGFDAKLPVLNGSVTALQIAEKEKQYSVTTMLQSIISNGLIGKN
ncbi:unnamed protein product [Allacma fusca]|uniref:Ankyrin repeat domain-containing protein 16 n=1 Tax=Allacma fusca TaxID=39272 RepID=A0A8J2IZU2_9HEXA|nr:unnamed protein product [Allacma fusca]